MKNQVISYGYEVISTLIKRVLITNIITHETHHERNGVHGT